MWRSVVMLCALARAVVCSCLPGSWQRRSLSRPCLVVCSCACARVSCDGQSVRAPCERLFWRWRRKVSSSTPAGRACNRVTQARDGSTPAAHWCRWVLLVKEAIAAKNTGLVVTKHPRPPPARSVVRWAHFPRRVRSLLSQSEAAFRNLVRKLSAGGRGLRRGKAKDKKRRRGCAENNNRRNTPSL